MKAILSFLIIWPFIIHATEFDNTFKGLYYWGPEVDAFHSCNEKNEYWLSYDFTGVDMRSFYRDNFEIPYQPMYIEFRGHLLDEKVDGFAESYSGLIRISEVYNYSFEIPTSCKNT